MGRCVIDALKSRTNYIGSSGRNDYEITESESVLGNPFAADYREYLEEIGLVCYDGHELTGITAVARLNVVTVTKEQRAYFGDEVSEWYVIELANIFGIVIWQDSAGYIYETMPGRKTIKIANSLTEYILQE